MNILPINKKPYARAFNSTGFPLSIMFAKEDSLLPFFLNTHIQVNRDLNKSKYSLYNFHHVPLFYFNWGCFETQILRKFNFVNNTISTKGFLEKNIDAGYYIVSYIDEFYISNRNCTGVQHFMHDSLLYGYDDYNYYILGYNNKGNYDVTVVEKDKFIHAFLDDNNINILNSFDVSQFIILLKIKPNFKENISINRIKLLTEDYLLSNNTANRLGIDVNFHSNYLFGIVAFKNLATEIITENYIDLRFIRLFYEHKSIMVLRLNFLVKQGYIKNDIYLRYLEIEFFAQQIYNISLKYIITKDKNLLKKISNQILELIENEKKILTDFINYSTFPAQISK
ncbi:hypothetical protein [Anaerocolumna jejuensis]|uniref:hypothetical protein n=1 Tax=Anaerocolumna jejuensis TaxID=259063 RepID=UPI003F7C196E